MTSPSPIDPPAMERLAFIRLLHQQGVDQSRMPQPLNFTCVLTFHDAVELFLMLASEHLGATIPERGRFVDRYFDNLNKHLNGTELSGRKGVGRLIDQRNGFKHANTWPGPTGIDQFRSDAVSFFEENTPKVFGIDFDNIDMADLVPDDEVRSKIKEAASAASRGDRIQGMSFIAEAFDDLFREHVGYIGMRGSPFSFGPTIIEPTRGSISAFRQLQGDTRAPNSALAAKEQLARHLDAITSASANMQKALRVMAIGIEHHKFLRFDALALTPRTVYLGERHPTHHPHCEPTVEEFEFCEQFVIEVALRIAEIATVSLKPSWLGGTSD